METIGLMQMSLSGGLLILAVLMIRAIAIDRLPKGSFLALWGIVLARLVLPVTFPLRFGTYSVPDLAVPLIPAALPAGLPVSPGTGTVSAPRVGLPVLTLIWLAGALALAGYFLTSYLRGRREFRTSLPVHSPFTDAWLSKHALRRRIEIRELSGLSTPLTYGVFHPVILVPRGMNWEDERQMRYILYHEYVHIRRLDAVWKPVAALVLCAHWFNPLVWVLYVLFNRDIELACDEQVIRHFGGNDRAAYAKLLIRMEEERGGFTALRSYFGKNVTEERVEHIMKFKKSTVFTLAFAVMLVAAGMVIAFTVGANRSGDVCFTIDGDTYSATPTVGDFLDNGWTLSEEDAVNLEHFSEFRFRVFNIVKGDDQFAIYLNDSDVERGLKLAECRVRTLDFSSGLPKSFTLDGHGIIGATAEQIREFYGEPDETAEADLWTVYSYTELNKDISEVTIFVRTGAGVEYMLLQLTKNQ